MRTPTIGDTASSDSRYREIAEAIPQIVWVAGTDGLLIYTNRNWEDYTGFDHRGKPDQWENVLHPDDREHITKSWRVAIHDKKPYETQVRLRRWDGSYRWFLSRGVPLLDTNGDVYEWVGTNTDIEEQKHVEESLKFLAQASEILSESLNYERTLKRVAALAVPKIADWCSVEIVTDNGELKQLAVEHVDPTKIKLAEEFREKYPTDPNAPTGVPQVIRTGKSEVYYDITDEMLVLGAKDEEHLRLIRELGLTSIITVPLVARGIAFGALSLVSAETKRRFTETDVQLAEDLGRRAAMAVDNAWLYQKAQMELAEREETGKALRESEQQYRIVAETATDAIVTIDGSSTILFANPAVRKIFGYELNEVLGKDITMLMPEMFRTLHKKAIDRYIDTHVKHIDWEGVELPGLHRDGHEIPLEISFGEFKHAGRQTFTGIVRDITERKRVEEELRNSEMRFRTMIEQSPLGIQLFDLDGNCIKANRAWEELWSAKREDLKGYNIRTDPQIETSGMKSYVEQAYAGESVVMPPFEYNPAASGRPGRPRWVRVFLYPVKNEANDVNEVAIILEDITERRKANQELRQAKERAEKNEQELEAANQAKDRFLAVLSHELRTPLTPVMATVQTLQLDPEMKDSLPWLDLIQRNIELEARLIDDLLDLTRITRGKLQLNMDVVDLHVLIENVLDIYRSEINAKQLKLTVELEASEHTVNADPARLQQVFWNLIKNAVKFTPDGGKLLVHTSNTETNPPGILIEVTDSGIGIEQETLPRIFDAFEQGETTITRTFGGLGLGLSISKNLVDLHGGSLTAMSPGKDKGSTFLVELDTSGSADTSESSSKTIAASNGVQTSRILLVDDHVDTSTAVKMLLERQGFKVAIANTASEALGIAEKSPFDLLISDIGLPDESGLSLVVKIKAAQNIPAIALSGFGTEEDIQRSKEAGFQEHLTKPFNLNKLRETILRLLGKQDK